MKLLAILVFVCALAIAQSASEDVANRNAKKLDVLKQVHAALQKNPCMSQSGK